MKALMLATFFMLFAMVGVNAYWLLEKADPPSVSIEQSARNAKGERQTEFKAGDILWIYSKQRVVRSGVPRLAIQSIWSADTNVLVTRYPPLASPTPPEHGISFPVPLPVYLPAGSYEHRVTIRYRLNPIRNDAEFDLPAVRFRIVE